MRAKTIYSRDERKSGTHSITVRRTFAMTSSFSSPVTRFSFFSMIGFSGVVSTMRTDDDAETGEVGASTSWPNVLRGVFLMASIACRVCAALEARFVCSKFSIFPLEALLGGAKNEKTRRYRITMKAY